MSKPQSTLKKSSVQRCGAPRDAALFGGIPDGDLVVAFRNVLAGRLCDTRSSTCLMIVSRDSDGDESQK